MKKHIFTVLVLLLSLALNAQVSVWDGSYEPYDTIYAGTEDDPILIENAAQLAYMATLSYSSTSIKYYKLMVDVDLNNHDWCPIGYRDLPSYVAFYGYFDGCNHTIYHLNAPLFYWIQDGSLQNITIRESNINIPYYPFGSVAVSAPLIENCHNYGTLIYAYDNCGIPEGDAYVGGVVGTCGTIRNCSNHGFFVINVTPRIGLLCIGGVASEAGEAEMCYNEGTMLFESEISSCYVGGICGQIDNRVSYCYNTADLAFDYENSNVGGIMGRSTTLPNETIVINSCYSAGSLAATNVGGIVAAKQYDNSIVSIGSCYYINTVESLNDFGIPKSEPEMKTQEFVDLLNNGGNVFAMDLLNVNNGFPVFSGYTSIVENQSQYNALVYPNPARDYIRIELQDDSSCQSIAIYSIDGRLVETFPATSHPTTINISGLNAGMYIMKVRLSDGMEYSQRIVKE